MIFKEKGITDILNIEDKANMVSELYYYLVEKCHDGDDLTTLTPLEKNLYLCESFELEVNNGGFYRFFWNSTGNYTYETIEALKAINALDTAKLIHEATSLFPEGKVSVSRDERQDFMNNDDTPETDNWEEYDQKFFANSDNLVDLCYAYALANKESFK